VNAIVSGEVGVGKTTVCEKIVEMAKRAGCTCGGILTPKVLNNGVLKGIDVIDIESRQSKVLASVEDAYKGPRIGNYFFNPEGIKFGVEAIERGASSDLLLIDEIGYLELRGEGFVKGIELVGSEEVKNSILVIRKELLSAFLARLGTKLPIFEVTINNRDELPSKIYPFLSASLSAPSLSSQESRTWNLNAARAKLS
jgi:nucleoside-triphosphatase THEP1